MPSNIRTIPAILTDDKTALEKLVRQTETFTDYAQFDLMDGCFVPSNSVSAADIAALKTTISWEAHLMVLQPEEAIRTLQQAGAKKIVFHFEAVSSPEKIISLVKNLKMQAGLAINPETPVAAFKQLVPAVDSVLFMAVHPGFYGAKFLPEVLDKIMEFRRTYFNTKTGIDGGVKDSNIQEIARTGVDEICVGSAIFLQPDPGAAYRRLSSLAQSAAA